MLVQKALVMAGLCSVAAAVHEPSRAFPSSSFKSQCSQDRWIYDNVFSHLLGNVIPFFVEFGARDGVRHSNSYFFEKALNWQGVLIEAGIDDIPHLRANRRCALNTSTHRSACIHGALGPLDEGFVEHQTYCGARGGHSVPCAGSARTIVPGSDSAAAAAAAAAAATADDGVNAMANASTGRVRVPRISLNRTLHRLRVERLGLLSADCEGCELGALEHFDFGRYRPQLVLLETGLDGSKQKLDDTLRLADILRLHDYAELRPTVGLDGYFVSAEVARQIPRPCLDHVCGMAASKHHSSLAVSKHWQTNGNSTDCKYLGVWWRPDAVALDASPARNRKFG
jgi:hypothetical protein